VIVLLQVSPDSDSEKKFENWSLFDEVKAFEVKAYKNVPDF